MRITHGRLLLVAVVIATAFLASAQAPPTSMGGAIFADWEHQQPGARHKITVADLPAPNPEEAVSNTPYLIPRPEGAWPIEPPGFRVTLYAGGDAAPLQRADNKEHMELSGGTFTMPRLLRTAPQWRHLRG